ncbi:hypothetical protein D0Z03_002959 [Geotrichum reessii]|nr:hypothetical protein D0Z03_002959 [Galactomyces reessii]
MSSSQLDALSFIDPEISAEERTAVNLLIEKETRIAGPYPHPDLRKTRPSRLSPELEDYVAHISTSRNKGIDASRYTLTDSDAEDTRKLYLLMFYAQQRRENLELLAQHGKNQWLLGNDQFERDLKVLELALQEDGARVRQLTLDRETQQTDVRMTFEYLENRWRESLKNVVDVNVACLGLEATIAGQNSQRE